MFDGYCRSCRSRVLLTTARILSLENTSEGIVVYFRCWCGTPGVLITGRHARSQRAPATSSGVTHTAGPPQQLAEKTGRAWGFRSDPKVQRLARVPALAGLRRRQLRTVARIVDEVDVGPGTVLASAGRPAVQGFLLLSGRLVALCPRGGLWLVEPGTCPGLAELAAGQTYTLDVSALTASRLIVLTSKTFAAVTAAVPGLRARLGCEQLHLASPGRGRIEARCPDPGGRFGPIRGESDEGQPAHEF